MDFIGSSADGEFFAAANTEVGFVCYFDELFYSDNIGRRYIIKGGPGTGKSTLMRRIAERARSAGRDVCTFYCSSDTSSLDGIIIDGRIAVLDGTAPHTADTRLPGARDEIINLGGYWDSALLRAKEKELLALAKGKKDAYSLAYNYLFAAGATERALTDMIGECVKSEKMSASVDRLCERCFEGRKKGRGEVLHRQVSAFGVYGNVHLHTLYDAADTRYALIDHYGTARLYMAELLRCALESGQRVAVSHNAVCTSVPDEMYFPDTGALVYVCGGEYDENDIKINMKRFTDASAVARLRGYYRAAHRAGEVLCEIAQRQLTRAGELHAESEKIYVSAMDFDALREYTDRIIDRIIE